MAYIEKNEDNKKTLIDNDERTSHAVKVNNPFSIKIPDSFYNVLTERISKSPFKNGLPQSLNDVERLESPLYRVSWVKKTIKKRNTLSK